MKADPIRGTFNALIGASALWLIACLAWFATGCVAKGSWEYGGTIPLLGEWKCYGKITPPKDGELPTTLTFEDKVMDWIVGPVTAGSTGADGSTQTNP